MSIRYDAYKLIKRISHTTNYFNIVVQVSLIALDNQIEHME